jgi:hypothetical protein
MKHLKKFEDYSFPTQEISEAGMSPEIFGGWDQETINTMEKTIAELYDKVISGTSNIKSKISKFFSHGEKNDKLDNLDNENEYISYLDANFDYINWKDEKTAKYYIDTAKSSLLGDKDPEVIRKICSTIYHLIEQ